jgi:hypothetical protein
MVVTRFAELIRGGKGRICFVAIFGFFAAFHVETLCKMFFLLGIGFFVLGLLLGFAGDTIGLAVHCVGLLWQCCRGLLAWLLVAWRGGMRGR